jgi:Tol biopolymer transport system component
MPSSTAPLRALCRYRLALAAPALTLAMLGACSDDDGSGGTGGGGGPSGPATPLDAGRLTVVYAVQKDEASHLWLAEDDAGDPVQLTDGDGSEFVPTWSPDGTRIVFAAAANPEDDYDLWVINADGTGLDQLTDTDDVGEGPASWSPDGTQLVYTHTTGEAEGDIRVIDLDNPDAGSQVVADLGDWVDWSPDGRTILYTGDSGSGGQLFTVPVNGGDPTALEPDGPTEAYEASWSPDGSQIAFIAPSGDSDSPDPAAWNEDIWVMNADGSEARLVVTTTGNDHWVPAWSPDGGSLMYSADGEENEGELARVDLKSGEVTVLTDNDVHDLMPSWRHHG